MRIALFTRADLSGSDPTRLRVLETLKRLNVEVVLEGARGTADAVVVLGGDGTLLRAVQELSLIHI